MRTVDQGSGLKTDLHAGSTPLHAAAFRGELGIVQAILQVRRLCRGPGPNSCAGMESKFSPVVQAILQVRARVLRYQLMWATIGK